MDGNRRLTTMCTEKLYKNNDHQRRYFRYTPTFPETIKLDDTEQRLLDVMEAAGAGLIYKTWSKDHPENNEFNDSFK